MSAGTFAGAAAAAAAGDRSDEIRLITRSYTGIAINPTTAQGTIDFLSDGRVEGNGITTADIDPAVNADEWHRDNPSAGLGDDWEIQATLTAGDSPSINAGLLTWLRLDVARTWGNARSFLGVRQSTLTFEFRLFGTTTVLKTVTGSQVAAVQDP